MAKKKKEDYKNPTSGQPITTQKTSPEKKTSPGAKSPAKKAEPVVKAPAKKATPVSKAPVKKAAPPPAKTSAGDKAAKSATARYTDPRNIITPNERGGASRKEKLQSFGKAMGKNLAAGAANSTIKNQQHYWTNNDPAAEKYVSKHISGMNTDRDVEHGLNENYVTEHLLDFLFDTSRNAGREHNEGSYFSQADNDRYMRGVEDYWRKQQQREAAADTATENMLNTIDPQSKTGEVLLNAAAGIARELPAMAEEAIITAASAGALGPEFAGMRIGKIGARLLKAAPATTARTMRYFDQAFQDALDNGATQDEAIKAASRTALPNAVIESAGGLDALAAKLGSGAARSAGGSVLRSAARVLEVPASEAVEEGLQGMVERSAKKTTYDEDAVVFDVNQILNDMALGAAGGAILGSAMGVIRRGLTANSQSEIASIIQNEAEREGLPVSDYEARTAAEQIIGRVLREQEKAARAEQAAPIQGQGGQAGLDLIQRGVGNADTRAAQQPTVGIQENPDGTATIPVSDTETAQRPSLPEQQNASPVDEVLQSMGLLTNEQENAAESLARPLTATDGAARNYTGLRPVQTLTPDQARQEVYDLLNEEDSSPDAFRARPDPNDMAEFVDQLTYGFTTRADKAALTEQVSQIAEMWMNGEIQPAEVKEMARNIATAIMDEEGYWDTEEYDNAKELRNYFRTTPIRVPDDLREKGRDGFQRAIRDYFGKIRFSNSPQAIPLDEAYLEAQGLFPGYLPDEERMIGSGGQLKAIMRVLDGIQPVWRHNFADEQYEEVTDFIADQIVGYATGSQYGQTHLRQEPPTNTIPLDEGNIPVRQQEQAAQQTVAQGEAELVTPEMSVPQGEGEIRERGFSNNTLQRAAEAGTLDKEIADTMAGNTYSTVTNEQTRATAAAAIDKYGVERIENYILRRGASGRSFGDRVIDRGNLSSVEFAAALELMRRFSDMGLKDRALTMGEIVEAANTDAGRLIQYNQTLMATDPILYVTKQTKQAAAKGVELSDNRKQALAVIADAVKKAEDGTWDGTLDFSGINTLKGNSQGVGIVANPVPAPMVEDQGLTSKQAEHFRRGAEWIHRIASQTNYTEAEWLAALGSSCLSEAIPAKFESIVGAARRINLLLNLKTTAVRNGGGNLLQMVLENVADLPSAMFAAMLKGNANPKGKSSVRLGAKGMASGFSQGFMTSYLALQTGTLQQLNNRYADMTEMGTRLGGSSENLLWQAFRFMDDITSFAVSVLDTSFSTSREQQVKNQFASVLNDGEYAELTEELNKIAEEAGQRVTFTNDNPIKTLVTKARSLGRELQRSDKASTRLLGNLTTTAFQMLMPFAGVTSTILHTSLSYSPVGFVSGIVDLVGESAKQGGTKNLSMEAQRRIATKLGRAVTGSLLSFAAMFLAAAGKATGRKPDDEVESAIWDITGRTPYSIKFGDYWYDLSALGPAMGLVSVGASVYDELGGEMSKENLLPLIKGLMFNSTNIHLNDTLDDGLWDGVKKAAGYIGDRDWGGLMQYLVGQGLGQFTPFSSILRQITYGIDPVIHDTSGENEWEWIWNRELSGLPGVSSSLPASRDAMGRVRERYPNADTDLGRWVNALFNPAATVTQDRSDDPLVQEYASLAMATGDDSVLPGKAPYSLRGSGNVKLPLAGAEREQYQADRMGMTNDAVWNLMYEPFYQSLSAEEQASLVKKITGLAEYEASAPLSQSHPGFEMSDQSNAAKLKRQVDAFDTQGVDMLGYFDWYYLTKDINALDENGESVSGLKKSRVAEAIKTNMAEGYTPDQMYWMFLITNGINDPYADKNGYYQSYFGATQSRADFFPELYQ